MAEFRTRLGGCRAIALCPVVYGALFGALVGILPPQHANASSLRVTPIRVTMAPDKRFCSLTLSNDGDLPVNVQVRGFDWSRTDSGEDVLTESGAIRVNPGIVTLPAHGSQLIRCAVPEQAAPGEQAWRLVFDELPPPAGTAPGGTILTLLRISVPVFRSPSGVAPRVVWSQQQTASGGPALVLENTGSAHAQIRGVTVTTDPPAAAPPPYEQGFYLLPGGRMVLPLPAAPQPTAHILNSAPNAAQHRVRITGVSVQSPEGPLDVVPAR